MRKTTLAKKIPRVVMATAALAPASFATSLRCERGKREGRRPQKKGRLGTDGAVDSSQKLPETVTLTQTPAFYKANFLVLIAKF